MMKGYTLGSTWWLVTALAVSVNLTALAQDDDSKPVPGTREASCIVRITSDPALLPIDGGVIERLVVSTPVSGEAARKVFGSELERRHEDVVILFEQLSSSVTDAGHTLVGALSVNVPEGVRPAAREFLAEVCRRLEKALAQAGAVDEERMHARLGEVARELDLVDRQFGELRVLQQQLRDQAGRADLSRERIEGTIHDLERTRASLRLELAGATAREAALVEQIAKIGRQIDQSLDESEVAAELQKVVEIRLKEVARVQQLVEQNLAASRELDEAQEEFAHARAALASYRESASEKVGGGLLAGLNKELVELAVESAEMEAELRSIEAQLSEIRERKLLQLADRYDREVQLQLRFAERAVQALTTEQDALKRQLRSIRRPAVIVIGGM